MKKVFSLILALPMMVSMALPMVLSSSAAPARVVLTVSKAVGAPGDTVDVFIRVNAGSGIVGMTMSLVFDASKVEIQMPTGNAAAIRNAFTAGTLCDGLVSMFSANYISADSKVKVSLTLDEEIFNAGNLLKLRFRIKGGWNGETLLTLVQAPTDTVIIDDDLQNIPFTTVSGKVTMSTASPTTTASSAATTTKQGITTSAPPLTSTRPGDTTATGGNTTGTDNDTTISENQGETVFVTDAQGNPVPVTDPQGEPVTDTEGNTVYQTEYRPSESTGEPSATNSQGKPVYVTDAQGNRVPVTDAQGEPVTDEEGNTVYATQAYADDDANGESMGRAQRIALIGALALFTGGGAAYAVLRKRRA